MSLTQEIREFALDLGYSRVGFIPFYDFADYRAELDSRGDMYDWFTDEVRFYLSNMNPRDLSSFAKSVIVLVWDYSRTTFPENLVGKVGRAYQARCYLPPEHRINGSRIALFRSFLREKGCDCETDICLPDRWAGAMSGVTTYGKNTLAYADGVGSFIILKSVVVDKELEYDPVLDPKSTKCPNNCRACLDACPTGALYEPFKLDSKRCISYNTFSQATFDAHIPLDIREKMGSVIHGCDVCQQVCPRNQSRLKQNFPRDEFLEIVAGDFTLAKLLHLDEDFYWARVEPIMYNYIPPNQKWLFQRNAAIAIGNSGDQNYVDDLIEELNHPQEAVRSHVAWALGRLGGPKADAALFEHLKNEKKPTARKETEWALNFG